MALLEISWLVVLHDLDEEGEGDRMHREVWKRVKLTDREGGGNGRDV